MELPLGFDEARIHGKVYKLKKSLYSLKQSPWAWFSRFMKLIRQQGYQLNPITLYSHKGDKTTIIIVYVNDIILTSDDIVETERLRNIFVAEFEIKDLGPLRYFLSMEVARNRSGISISQRKYVLDLLVETWMLGCKPIDTPINPNLKLREQSESTLVNKS